MSTRWFCLLLLLAVAGCSSQGYQRQGGKWVYVLGWDGSRTRVVSLADARGELKVLPNPNYATTTDNVYLRGVKLPGADPATLKLLTFPYSKDAARVFAGSIPIKGADPNTFRVLGGYLEPSYLTEARVYENLVGPFDTVPRHAAIVGARGWGADDKACFLGPTRVDGADPGSFVVLNHFYAKDANRVYFGHRTVPEADVATFRVKNNLQGEDKKHKYFKWEIDEK